MIYESYPWKKELRRLIGQINKIIQIQEPDDNKLFHFEKHVFLSAYIIRKLVEAKKLSDRTRTIKIEVKCYPNKKIVTLINWGSPDKLYSFDEEKLKQIDVEFLSNQIIHSYVFIPFHNERCFIKGFFVSSDYKRNTEIYTIPIEVYVSILNEIASDEVNAIDMHYDVNKKDYVFTKAE